MVSCLTPQSLKAFTDLLNSFTQMPTNSSYSLEENRKVGLALAMNALRQWAKTSLTQSLVCSHFQDLCENKVTISLNILSFSNLHDIYLQQGIEDSFMAWVDVSMWGFKNGAYELYCLETDKTYIGVTKVGEVRWQFHLNDAFVVLKQGELQDDIRKYGAKKFGKLSVGGKKKRGAGAPASAAV